MAASLNPVWGTYIDHLLFCYAPVAKSRYIDDYLMMQSCETSGVTCFKCGAMQWDTRDVNRNLELQSALHLRCALEIGC